MRLADVIGHDRIVDQLRRAIASGHVPHAYLFDGPEGVGKRSIGVGLALALSCTTSPGEGCGACDGCRRMLAGLHPDLRVVAPETAQIVIDQIREIVALCATRPHEAAARVVIVDGADAMNAATANALLKTLEEPAAGNHLVLVTAAPDRLLPTIRSRAQRLRFAPLPPPVLLAIGKRQGIEAARAEVAVALGDGSAARFVEFADGEAGERLWSAVTELRRAARERGVVALMDAAAAVADKESKERLPALLSLLGRFYRDVLAVAAGAPGLAVLRTHAGEVDRVAAGARACAGLAPVRRALAAVAEAEAALAANANATLAVERLLFELRPCERAA